MVLKIDILKGLKHDFRLKLLFNFFCIKWLPCAFWMIDRNLNVRVQVMRDTEVNFHCYVNKAGVL